MHGRTRVNVDPRITTIPGRNTSGSLLPERQCLLQMRNAKRRGGGEGGGLSGGIKLDSSFNVRCLLVLIMFELVSPSSRPCHRFVFHEHSFNCHEARRASNLHTSYSGFFF